MFCLIPAEVDGYNDYEKFVQSGINCGDGRQKVSSSNEEGRVEGETQPSVVRLCVDNIGL